MNIFKRSAVFILVSVLLFALIGCSTKVYNGSSESDENISDPYNGNINYETDYQEKSGSDSDADFAALYEQSVQSVVTVKVVYEFRLSMWSDTTETASNTGTGLILTENGDILTTTSLFEAELPRNNVYLFETGASSLIVDYSCQVILNSGDSYSAEWVSCDMAAHQIFPGGNSTPSNSDLSLIRISDAVSGLTPVTFADSESLHYGEDCYTIGTFSDEEDDLTGLMTEGIISQPVSDREYCFGESFFNRSMDYLIQTSITTNSGNAGAPLFDSEGKVIGVLNIPAEKTGMMAANESFGISFAVPSSAISEFLSTTNLKIDIPISDRANSNIILNHSELDTLKTSSEGVTDEISSMFDEFSVIDPSSEIILDTSAQNLNNQATISERIAAENLYKTVKIVVKYTREFMGTSVVTGAEGSGFIISQDGYVMTNLHVINKNTEENENNNLSANATVDVDVTVFCIFENGFCENKLAAFEMDIIAYDQQEDMAILKFKNPFRYYDDNDLLSDGFESICTLNTQTVTAGDPVVAIGNALAYDLSVSKGIVSVAGSEIYLSEYGHVFIQTDCPINSGNSGGPLFDADGYVVGINSMGLDRESLPEYENVSWAIPAASAKIFIDEVNNGSVNRGRIVKAPDEPIVYRIA